MSKMSHFTVEDVRRVNQKMIDKRGTDISKLTPYSQEVIRTSTFSSQEIKAAFAAARKILDQI